MPCNAVVFTLTRRFFIAQGRKHRRECHEPCLHARAHFVGDHTPSGYSRRGIGVTVALQQEVIMAHSYPESSRREWVSFFIGAVLAIVLTIGTIGLTTLIRL